MNQNFRERSKTNFNFYEGEDYSVSRTTGFLVPNTLQVLCKYCVNARINKRNKEDENGEQFENRWK